MYICNFFSDFKTKDYQIWIPAGIFQRLCIDTKLFAIRTPILPKHLSAWDKNSIEENHKNETSRISFPTQPIFLHDSSHAVYLLLCLKLVLLIFIKFIETISFAVWYCHMYCFSRIICTSFFFYNFDTSEFYIFDFYTRD